MKKIVNFSFLIVFLGLFSCQNTSKQLENSTQQETLPYGKIETDLGSIIIELSDATPNHKASFINLAKSGYWDSLSFNRVIPGFVAQGGCPDTPEGFSESPYLMDGEFVDSLKHIYGAVGAGRDDNPEKKSAACQFYIVQAKDGLARLDGDYTIFGQVIKGMDVVDAIVAVERDSNDAPLETIALKVDIIELTQEGLDSIRLQGL